MPVDLSIFSDDERPIKPRARIDDWVCANGGQFLIGRVSGHPRQAEFKNEWQATSSVIALDREARTAETLNTIYELGEEIK